MGDVFSGPRGAQKLSPEGETLSATSVLPTRFLASLINRNWSEAWREVGGRTDRFPCLPTPHGGCDLYFPDD